MRAERTWRCARGHSFDESRTGYLNLLQPQDRRSARPGDPAAAVEARQRLTDAGVGHALIEHLAGMVARLARLQAPVCVDLGCGSGAVLARVVPADTRAGVGIGVGIGIDLSTSAVSMGARARPDLTWVVANADRRLPLLDASVDLALSIHARRNPEECARVLRAGAWLIVAVPAPDDLAELRQAVHGERRDRDRAERLVFEHAGSFTLKQRLECREECLLTPEQLRDLLAGTYRGQRRSMLQIQPTVEMMTVTLASSILVFRRCP